jgi:2'-5' RNA ligase
MRVFFGLEASPDLAMQIADWRDRQLSHVGRPVPPANFHITLAFVGEIKDQSLEALASNVDQWVEQEQPCGGHLELDQTGYWPKPGIYWLGCANWPEGLGRLADKLKSLATAVGGKRDRNSFQPHLTLLRGCRQAPTAPAASPGFSMEYDHFTLYESRQGRSGVSYHPLADWRLVLATQPLVDDTRQGSAHNGCDPE